MLSKHTLTSKNLFLALIFLFISATFKLSAQQKEVEKEQEDTYNKTNANNEQNAGKKKVTINDLSQIREADPLKVTEVDLYRVDKFPLEILQFKNLEKLSLHSPVIIPDEIGQFEKLKFLDLRSCDLYELPNSIYNLAELETLRLEENKILNLSANILQLKKLNELVVDVFTKFPKEIEKLTNLQSLEIRRPTSSNNGFPYRHSDTSLENIVSLVNLKKLVIENTVSSIPLEIGKLKKLEILDIGLKYGNKYFTNGISNLTSLKVLILSAYSNFGEYINTNVATIEGMLELQNLQNLNLLVISKVECKFPSNLFDKMTSLQNLSLDVLTNEIPSSIGKLLDLKILKIVSKNLKILPNEISNLSSLQELYLDCFYVKNIPNVSNLTNLRDISLTMNSLIELPKGMENLVNVVKFNLADSQVEELPMGIGKWKWLRIIKLQNNKTRILPKEIGSWESLEDLEMVDNQIEFLPDELGKCKNLRRVKVNNNKIKSFPQNIQLWTAITGIYASNNLLTELPIGIGKLQKLSEVNFSNNLITSLPEEIGNLKGIWELSFQNNKITNLPTQINGWKNLSRLNLSNNNISSINSNLYSLEKLQDYYFNISSNPITTISKDNFEWFREKKYGKSSRVYNIVK